jgi:two-component system probable response regulator PhcQ
LIWPDGSEPRQRIRKHCKGWATSPGHPGDLENNHMGQSYDDKQYTVLFVDDESQALKYFKKATDKEFDVVTASSVAEAWSVLAERADEIAVVVTDQRMPQEQGVELLSRLKNEHPNIVRILTTAYSDLDSAIDAVNSGQIFYYITKPWNVRELRVVLMRAMEFFLLQRDRDLLLGEKLSVFQRMLVQDRARALAVFAASLTGKMRFTLQALKEYIEQAPPSMTEPPPNGTGMRELWTSIPEQSLAMIHAIETAVQTLETQHAGFAPIADLSDAIGSAMGKSLEVDGEAGPIDVDAPLLETLCATLGEVLGEGTVTLKIEEAKAWGSEGVRLTFRGAGGGWSAQERDALFGAIGSADDDGRGMRLLGAFFIAFHHGGRLVVHPNVPQGPGFELLLPKDPDSVEVPALEGDWLENLFMRIESWV